MESVEYFTNLKEKGPRNMGQTMQLRAITGPGESSHGVERLDEHSVTCKETMTEATQECMWTRNFNEGVRNLMMGPTPPRPIYWVNVPSSRRHRSSLKMDPFADMTKGQLCWSVNFQNIPHSPEISEAEMELIYIEVWERGQEWIETLSTFLINDLRNVFDKNSFVHCLHPDTHFLAPQHKNFVIKAELCQMFFRNFEEDSFGTVSSRSNGACGSQAMANVRKVGFYQYFVDECADTDPDYEVWFRERIKSFCELLGISIRGTVPFSSALDEVTLLEVLGGPNLVCCFREVALACWYLHTLALAFKIPATRLQVLKGEEYDDSCMVPVVDMDELDDEFLGNDLVVSFVVAPGFYFGGSLIPAEVYLTSADSRSESETKTLT